jgi:predicted RNase H-like HicB family nuclease
MNYSINIQKNKNGWLTGQCEQIPEAITEGKDMDHLMKNMYDAISEALDIRKDDFLFYNKDINCIRKDLYLPDEEICITDTSKRERVHA